ncbi:CheY-like chemotaxis protein [Phycicoccus badiiscoriae]|uniref:CheY-like chemotaxis protein n=1 Tax=Pedococcus badiiscoriae TaxID=642776 RepID=A0A852WKP3_9MICO|nr:response regulator [Pedococcus badiiscoriae]NYG06056.1 CheY-like chemotaxis protein [Pedococcus badiiscoriae]
MERGGLVYVCDDTDQIRHLIRVNLELEGYDVCEAADGGELLEALQASPDVPGVITLDAQMGPRDGWWAISRIRADPRLAGIPVIMVTASVQQHDRVQAQGSGLDAFVSKPFDPDHLIALVSGFMAEGRAHQPAP